MAERSLRYNVEVKSAQALTELDNLWQQAQQGGIQAAKKINEKLGGEVKTVLDWEVRVDASGVKRLQPVVKEVYGEYEKLNSAQKKFNQTQEGSLTSLRQQLNTAKQLRDSVAKFSQEGKITAEWKALDESLRSINLKLAQAEGNLLHIGKARLPDWATQTLSIGNAFTQMSFAITAATQAFQAMAGAVEPIIQRAKQLEGLQLLLGGFVSSQSDVNAVLASAKGLSLQYGASLTQIETSYKRITPAILASGGTLGETEEIIASLAARTTQLGLNTEQSGRYIEAFAQVMGKGKLQSEELNQQFSELDGALRSQIASYLAANYGIADLNAAMKQGQVTATIFREAFIEVSEAAREKLASAIGQVQAKIDSLNIQQIENIRKTINTITLESLSKTFEGFGMAMQRVATQVSQFFAGLATQLPSLQGAFKLLFDILGVVAEVGFGAILNVVKIILHLFDRLIKSLYDAFILISKIPGIKPALDAVGQAAQWFIDAFREGFDAINGLGTAVDTSTQKLSKHRATVDGLKTAYDQGAISVGEYKRQLEGLRGDTQAISDAAKESFDQQVEAVKQLKSEIATRYEQENAKIEEQIDKRKDALSQEKDGLSAALEAAKIAHEGKMDLLNREIQKVKDRYALELNNINAQTAAQQEQTRLRKEKLAETVKSTEASYEERINAQAQLDTMRQQEQSANIRAQQEAALQALAAKKAQEEKAYQAEKKAMEEASQARQAELQASIKELTETLKGNKDAQAEINQQLDESIKLEKSKVDVLSEIPGLISQQLSLIEQTKTAYWDAQSAVSAVASEIERAARAQRDLNSLRSSSPAPNRFAGGGVGGGQKYTVNEFGTEGFLSASGRLSEIKAPAWSEWRAPSSGTVIPAGAFAAMKAMSAPAGVSGAGSMVSRLDGSGSLANVIKGLLGASGSVVNNNNVTIQAQNPTQVASDMMVQLTKLRRTRYS